MYAVSFLVVLDFHIVYAQHLVLLPGSFAEISAGVGIGVRVMWVMEERSGQGVD